MTATPETYTRTIRTMNEVLDVLRDEPDPDGALTVLADRIAVEREWCACRSATPQEARAIGFAGDVSDQLGAGGHHVHAPRPRLVDGARPAAGQQRAVVHSLRLHEQLLERGVRAIRIAAA